MSSFENISDLTVELATNIRNGFGSAEVFQEITVPHPAPPKDELYFCRLVAWGYVFINEAFPVAEKQLTGILRSSFPEKFSLHSKTKNIINYLRTQQSHNLPPTSRENEKKIRDIAIWHAQNSGDPIDWSKGCDALLAELVKIIQNLTAAWKFATEDPGDSDLFLENFKLAVNNDWPPYYFDELINRSAAKIGLIGFDAAAFRRSGKYVEQWRGLVAVFEDRESATEAISRVIDMELERTFGAH
ncbi:hypothetical protein [Pseudomonas sp. BF-R-30]|uniref:hypothetical protein n=1 Tax=Pseudomonas sp. BF-R-30 TaxID=2832384 RepID=UPI001CBC3217|nr:hypothetical protein [Pseudomonas sp. BF-R-30]